MTTMIAAALTANNIASNVANNTNNATDVNGDTNVNNATNINADNDGDANVYPHNAVTSDWHYPNQPLAQEGQDTDADSEVDVLVAKPDIAKPPMYAVIMYNDNYTPMDFVVYVLQSEFRHNIDDAVQIMLSIHNSGKGVAGIYPKDIAETKAKKVNSLAQREGYPLLTQIEPHQGE